MSREYAMSRVKDALKQSEGNHLKAHRLVMSWLENDTSILVGLAVPHMNSIVTHALSHIDPPAKEEAQSEKLDVNDDEIGELGNAILSSLSRGTETGSFGEDNPEGVSKPGKASQAHIDAINAMAKAAKDKK